MRKLKACEFKYLVFVSVHAKNGGDTLLTSLVMLRIKTSPKLGACTMHPIKNQGFQAMISATEMHNFLLLPTFIICETKKIS